MGISLSPSTSSSGGGGGGATPNYNWLGFSVTIPNIAALGTGRTHTVLTETDITWGGKDDDVATPPFTYSLATDTGSENKIIVQPGLYHEQVYAYAASALSPDTVLINPTVWGESAITTPHIPFVQRNSSGDTIYAQYSRHVYVPVSWDYDWITVQIYNGNIDTAITDMQVEATYIKLS